MNLDDYEDFVAEDNPALKQVCEAFDFANPQVDSVELEDLLIRKMVDHNGLGLAANQLGIPLRVFAIRAEEPFCIFNPNIVDASDVTSVMKEGCLSFEDMLISIKRPSMVRMRFARSNGEIETEKFGGLSAHVVQHEVDHLDGLTFFDRASKFHLDKAKKKRYINERRRKKFEKQLLKASYGN